METATMGPGDNYFDHTDGEATNQNTLDAVRDFLTQVLKSIGELPGDLKRIGDGLARQITDLLKREVSVQSTVAASKQGAKNLLDLSGDTLNVAIKLVDGGYFAGMKVPRKVRRYLQDNKDPK